MSPQKAEPKLEGIAIVGMACRFPGAKDVEEFWSNLRNGVESIRFFDRRELEEAGVPPSLLDDPSYVPAQGVLEGSDLFDAGFFGFTPRVSEATDPQQRVFLECAWEALERAGYDPASYRGAIGLFAGVSMNTYLLANPGYQERILGTVGEQQAAIGNRTDHLTTMVAYKLDLRGPAVTVQTTCSTSLVAVHLAVQSLLNYQCHMALAGGARVMVPQTSGYIYRPGGISSPDGHCRPFDARAQGTLTGSGAGVVVLKRLADAVKDGDPIHAVIRGTAINNDGGVKAGYTAPSGEGQAKVIVTAQAVAGVQPEEIGYVEAHGTATPLGDPIEVAALTRVFRAKTRRRGFCALGSVKSNFGHLDTAAGVAGLIKAALALKHGQIPPTLHFERPNPELCLEESPFYVPNALTEWRPESGPRRAGVSAFGIGGTNAHAVLEEAPPAEPSGPSRPVQLLLLSARSGSALEAATDNLRRHLETETDQDLADVAHTLRVGRRPFEVRRSVVCRGREEAVALLGSLYPGRVHTSLQKPRQRPLIFLFPGQGAQRARMGVDLYETEEVFRREVDRCSEVLAPGLGLDLRRELFAPEEESRLDETFLTQPALFVMEYALARLWMSWGISPQAMIGHSLGEYVAACLAGVFSLEDALRLVAERGRLMQALPPGAMLSVQLPEEELRQRLGERLSLAAANRPSQCVVSGPIEDIEVLERELAAEEVAWRRLRTSHAFHSAMVEPVLARFEEQFAGLELKPPAIPFLSNLTGRWIRPEEATDPGYWTRHLRSTVRFSDGVAELLQQGEGVFLEIGPGRTLSTIVRQHPAWTVDHLVLPSLENGREQDSEPVSLLIALGRLWVSGLPVDWNAFQGRERRRRVVLPTYPFEHRRYWFEPKQADDGLPAVLRGEWKKDLADWFWVPSWRRSVPPELLRRETLEPGQRWMVLLDETGLGEAVSARLEQLGQEVIRVTAGKGFARTEGGYTLSPGGSEDYVALLDDLRRLGREPQRIVHLWCVDRAGSGPSAAPGHALERAFFSLLFLAQALGLREGEPPLRIDVVSTGMQEVAGGDLRSPDKAALLGPCKVLPKEYPNLRCRSVDLTGPEEVEPLLAELLASATEGAVAHRGGHRWVQTFEPVRLERAGEEHAGLRPGGVYLVTGGFGGMGSTVAEHLARACGAKLILIGRTPLPPREEWEGWLAARGEEDPASRRIRQVQALEAMGAEVLEAGVDVSDREGMRRVLDESRRRFGLVNGVFHTAAVPPGGLAQLKTAEAAGRILAPKLEGTRVLASLLAEEGLDFFLLCSSRSAIFGPPGGIDYTAANAFLDAFAHAARTAGLPRVVSINWCGWDEVGMLAEEARDRRGRPAAEGGEPLTAYPLLDRRQVEPGRETYWAKVSARTHWLLNEHRIAGNPVVPGTGYLEMARAAAAYRGLERIEIRDVFFLTPLRLREDESRELRFTLEETDGRLEFHASSRPPGRAGEWQKHVFGRIEPLAPGEPERRDLAEIRQRCALDDLVPTQDEQNEDLGPRWQSVTRIHMGDGEVLAAVELPEAFGGDLESCALHPALLDRAASIGDGYLSGNVSTLPFSYQSLRILSPLPRKIFSYARLTDQNQEQSRGETISFDVDLLDESGNLLVEIRSYHKKRINDIADRLRLPEAAATPRAPRPDDLEDPEVAEEPAVRTGISPRQGLEAFRRILANPWAPQIVVSPNDLLEAAAAAEAYRPAQLDRKAEEGALSQAGPRHDRPDLTTPYASPESEIETRLAEIWRELLGFRDVGIHDNFFELGGDSVLAIQILARARKVGIEISPGEIFEHQTIAELAAHLERSGSRPGGEELAAPSIVPVPRDGSLPLSFAQERLWFLARLDPDSPAYCVPIQLGLLGRLSPATLAAALGEVVRRHEVLRTTFPPVQPYQRIAAPDPLPLPLPLIDLAELPGSLREAEAGRLVLQEIAIPFDLDQGPLLRARLVRLGPERHRFLLNLHHIVADGWSMGVLVSELAALYEAFSDGRSSPLPELPIQYADFAAWQRQWLEGPAREEQLAYWRQHLAGPPRLLELPTDRPRPLSQSFRGGQALLSLTPELSTALHALARHEGATLFMVLLAAAKLLLQRWSGQDDIVVGSPIADRINRETEGLVGCFLNTLALRTDLAGEPSFRDLLARVRETCLGAYAHQALPFEAVLEAIQPARDLSRTPLFQIFFNLLNLQRTTVVQLPDLSLEILPPPELPSKFDMTFYITERDGQISFNLIYNTDLFDFCRMEDLLVQWAGLLEQASARPDDGIGSFSLLTEGARQILPDPAAPIVIRWEDSVCERFAAHVRRAPERTALIDPAGNWSYGELDATSNLVASELRAAGIGSDQVVAIWADRSASLAAALMGVWKAGAVFFILDPNYPPAHLSARLHVARPRGWIALEGAGPVHAEIEQALAGLDLACRLRLSAAPLPRAVPSPPTPEPRPDGLAYIAFTSGTTGAPKAIAGTHRPLSHFLRWHCERFALDENDRFSLLSGLSHDPLLRDVFAPLWAGATLCIPEPQEMARLGYLASWMRSSRIRVAHLTPALGEVLAMGSGDGELPELRWAFFGGDMLRRSLVERLQRLAPGCAFVNYYGTTETPQGMSYHRAAWEGSRSVLPLGRGIEGVDLLVLGGGPKMRRVGIGEIGEICIRTPYLSLGYIGDEALTRDRFVPNPFAEDPTDRLYRTGDLGRYLPNGEVEIHGRSDHQVKVRGFRVEPNEIEAALSSHPGVHQAVVVARPDRGGSLQLVAFFVSSASSDHDAVELREHLRRVLPDYMVPSELVAVQELPLTPNGKVDRGALVRRNIDRLAGGEGAAFLAPRGRIEEELAAIWTQVLGVERIGVHDNFFDAGGHSLRLVEVQAGIRRALGREVPVVELFRNPTIASLAACLGGNATAAAPRSAEPRTPAARTVGQDVAIIGMEGRFPGAPDLEQFWRNLRDGVESIARLSDEQLLAAGIDPRDPGSPGHVRAEPLLDGVDLFDAAFFGFSPREAQALDPQQRVFLECAWTCLERAGYDPSRYAGRIGVFAGAGMATYAINVFSNPEMLAALDSLSLQNSIDKDHLATRVAYKLGLRGPGVTVQTSCSTSLVAVHLARQSLLAGESHMALAGGVALKIPQGAGYHYREGAIMSPDGHCRAFDARALGTVFGSGVGVVLLKRLEDALRDGDTIHAVLKGSAINNDGALKVGYTAPSVNGQAEVITAAQEAAGISPESVTYVEAHGTGTTLGDPIEVVALTQAFRRETGRTGFCAIGSVKTNVGHLGAAAGIAGLIKTALSLEHRQIPPSLHFEEPNPQIDFLASPFYVNARLSDWTAEQSPRRAGLSSLGIGGTNAHAILEEAPSIEPSAPSRRRRQILLLSAQTPRALEESTRQLAAFLDAHTDVSLPDVAWTLQVGRQAFLHRQMLVCEEVGDAVAALRDPAGSGRVLTRRQEPGRRGVAFLFPGQGAQYPDMGRELYQEEPIFRAEVDACAERLLPLLDRDLRELLFPPAEQREQAARELRKTRFAQPALFTIEIALARLWISWGIQPEAMIGHSLGEYVAACLAGVFSLEDALELVAFRGAVMQDLPSGAMLSVELPESELRVELEALPGLSLAAVNAPSSGVASGPKKTLETLETRLAEKGVQVRWLHTSHAFHSAMVEPVLEVFAERVARAAPQPPTLPFVSNVTGTWITTAQAVDPMYWARHLRETVRFSDGIATLLADSRAVLLEVGPGHALGNLARKQTNPANRPSPVSSLPRSGDPEPGSAGLLGALGRLWLAGVEVDWQAFHAGELRHRVSLPTYPFQRQRFWVDAPLHASTRMPALEPGVRPIPPLSPEPGATEPVVAIDPDKTLATLPRPDLSVPYQAPRSDLEHRIAGVWESLLGINGIGVHDDFFDLGGHSLLATRLASRLREDFRRELPLDALFSGPTVAQLAARLESEELALPELPPIVRVSRKDPLPLSFAQQRLLFLHVLSPGDVSYNLPLALRFRGPLEPLRLRGALRRLVARHEVLRTTFSLADEQPLQQIAPEGAVELPLLDLSALPEALTKRETLRFAAEETRRPFDLFRGPVLRAALLRLGPGEHVLVADTHHIAVDGWSWGVFYREMAELYEKGESAELPELQVQYADFAVWQRQWLQGEALVRQLECWRQRLAGLPPTELPSDRPRPPVRSGHGAALPVALAGGLTETLRALGRQEDATLFMALLAAFAVLVHRHAGTDKLVLGTDIANRTQAELEGLIGLFVNQLVLTCDLSEDPTFREILRRVRRDTLEAYAYQDAPFDRLVELLKPERDMSRTPLFQLKLVLQNTPLQGQRLQNLSVSVLEVPRRTAKFDLLLNLTETGDGITGHAEYSTDLFDAATIARLLDGFTLVLQTVSEHPDAKLSEIGQILGRSDLQAREDKARDRRSQVALRTQRRRTAVPVS